ncbi:MAG: DUF3473 domain-containing protein [Chitinivibrionales bacterium]|nr:DUF3473 domain-containing protein [Chitinivibrionales bacterium]
MKNALSVDLEDWFCVYNFSQVIAIEQWDTCELRIVRNTQRLLELFSKHSVHATFFVLGWIAEHVPELIRLIQSQGHEIATHGHSHIIVKRVTPQIFEADLSRSITAIKSCVDTEIIGFRAPSFSISMEKTWIFDILHRFGIRYDSSLFPISFHPDYANQGKSLSIYPVTDSIIEFPLGCFQQWGITLPCSGGAYFRFFPYAYTAYGINRCNREGRPVVFYLHPWEIDPGQPRVKSVSFRKQLRHYLNLNKTFDRLERLLTDFEFAPCASVLGLR